MLNMRYDLHKDINGQYHLGMRNATPVFTPNVMTTVELTEEQFIAILNLPYEAGQEELSKYF